MNKETEELAEILEATLAHLAELAEWVGYNRTTPAFAQMRRNCLDLKERVKALREKPEES